MAEHECYAMLCAHLILFPEQFDFNLFVISIETIHVYILYSINLYINMFCTVAEDGSMFPFFVFASFLTNLFSIDRANQTRNSILRRRVYIENERRSNHCHNRYTHTCARARIHVNWPIFSLFICSRVLKYMRYIL